MSRQSKEGRPREAGKWRILVVCLGNICRSPAAEAALVEAAARAGVSVSVDSAGTGPWHVGRPPHSQMVDAGRRAGLEIAGHGRQVTHPSQLEPYDVILAMDRSNLAELHTLAPDLKERMHLFRSFDPEAGHDEVPDPYGLTDPAYEETVRIVRSAAAGVVAALRSGRLG